MDGKLDGSAGELLWREAAGERDESGALVASRGVHYTDKEPLEEDLNRSIKIAELYPSWGSPLPGICLTHFHLDFRIYSCDVYEERSISETISAAHGRRKCRGADRQSRLN